MRRITIVAILALLLPQLAFGWGKVGHKTVAEIAERNLTPKAKRHIRKYIGKVPLADLSLWMDQVRNENIEPYKSMSAAWHASIADCDCTSPQVVRDRYRGGNDGVTAMYNFREQLKNYRKMPKEEVAAAIKFMIHIVGDFHCPSHLRYVDYENKGNFAVNFMGKKSYLHKVWDSGVVGRYHKGWDHINYADHLNTLSEEQIEAVTAGWAQEWFESAARDVRPAIYWVYDGKSIETLDQKFLDKAGPLAEQQMQKAGYRLAKALNEIFK